MKVKVAQSCPTLCGPMDYTVHGILQAWIPQWVAFPFSRGSFQPWDPTQISHIAGRFFTTELQGKPKNTGMGSLSLLQRVFPTQKPNQGLLHCRRILYQLSYEGSPQYMMASMCDEVKWSEVAQSCPTLCDPMDCSLPGSYVHGILQARILEWAAVSFSRGSSRPRDWTRVSCIGGRRFNLWATREAPICDSHQ